MTARSPAPISVDGPGTITFTITGDTTVALPVTATGFVTLNGVQTLTNKTIDATQNTITNISIDLSSVSGTLLGVNGGTGVSNSGKTITIGGNLAFSGAFATTFTVTNTTAVTLPTSGTLLSDAAVITGAQGGTNNAFFQVTGPNLALRTFTFPNADATVLTSNAVVTGAQGGTGVANTSKTITLGGNLTTAGAFTTTFNVTANTAVTLPVTGTLATLSNVETFINKTIVVVGFTETVVPRTIVTNALTIDLNTGTMFTCPLNANITTFTINNAAAGKSFTLIFTADGTVRTITGITANANISFGDAGVPTLNSTNGKKNWLGFSTDDGTHFACTARTGF